jgi:tRNA pseudouridine38-40 synthase
MQVAHFDTTLTGRSRLGCGASTVTLPASIGVLWAVEVDDDFHARFSAESRRYRYVLLNRRVRPGLLGGRVGWTHGTARRRGDGEAAQCLDR